jgi:hypothetical protein
VKEHFVNDTEEAARRLFAAAAEEIPPGIDLLRGVRGRRRARVVRIRVLLSAGVAAIVTLVAAITLSAVQAPSALAEVTQAAARTAAQSYEVNATITMNGPGLGQPRLMQVRGEFDPARGLGEETVGRGTQVLYAGGYMYLPLTGPHRIILQDGGKPIPAGKTWFKLSAPLREFEGLQYRDTAVQVILLGSSSFFGVDPINPLGLLALLESASQVREVGPASGPGWTGTAYAYTATVRFGGPHPVVASASGTVDVDQQGRVRRLDATELAPDEIHNVRKVEMTFGDFGVRVSVSAPPASETFAYPPASARPEPSKAG